MVKFHFEGGLLMPTAFTIFQSMHSTTGEPSRVASGSWATAYRSYPMSCKWFDEALHDTYFDDLYIASAGNDGYDEVNNVSRPRTLGNPASCKNTLAGTFHLTLLYFLFLRSFLPSIWNLKIAKHSSLDLFLVVLLLLFCSN